MIECISNFKMKNLLAKRKGQTLAIVPDLITIVDRETAHNPLPLKH